MGFLLQDDPNGPGIHPQLPPAPEPSFAPHQGLDFALHAMTTALGDHAQSFRQRLLEHQIGGQPFAPAKQIMSPTAVSQLLAQIPHHTASPDHSNLLGLFSRIGQTMQASPQHQPALAPPGGFQY